MKEFNFGLILVLGSTLIVPSDDETGVSSA